VTPHLYRTQPAFYRFGGGFDRVGLHYQSLAAKGFYIALGRVADCAF
jgi:hypothetical protein